MFQSSLLEHITVCGNMLRNAVHQGNLIFLRSSATAAANHISDAERNYLASAKPFDEIPGFKRFPVIGSTWVYFPIIGKYKMNRLHHADAEKFKLFGNIVRDKFGSLNVVSCYRPEDLESVLRKEGKYPNRGELTSLKAYRESRKELFKSTGVLILEGKEWYDLRSKVQPDIMKPRSVLAYVDPMQDVAKDLVRIIQHIKDSNNEVFDTVSELHKWAMEAVGVIALDTRLGCLSLNLAPDSEGMKMIQAVKTTFDCMNHLEPLMGNLQIWKVFPTPTWRKFVKAMDVFSSIALKHVQLSLENIRKTPKTEEKELTLLQTMLCKPGLDMSGTAVTVLDLLFGGIDTTSNAMGFLLYNLAKNPDKQEKLYQEITSILPSKSDRLTKAATNDLRYLKACMKESLRLTPSLRGHARCLDQDVVLSGYKVPAGTTIFGLMQTASKLDENYENADQYIPERWLDKNKKHHPFLFVPFGAGVRSCLGRRLAELEMLCLTTEIIRAFKIEYHYEDIDMYTRMLNIADRPLRIRFLNRD